MNNYTYFSSNNELERKLNEIMNDNKNQNHKGIGKKAEINAKFLYLIIKYVILHPSNFKLLEEYKKYDDYNDVKDSNIIKYLKISNTPYFFY